MQEVTAGLERGGGGAFPTPGSASELKLQLRNVAS